MIEERQDVVTTLVQGPPELRQFLQSFRDAGLDRVDQLRQRPAASGPVLVAVGGNDVLVETPGDLDLGVILDGKQGIQADVLPCGEQPDAGLKKPAGLVEGIVAAASAAGEFTLNPLPRLVQLVTGQRDDVERSITVVASGTASAAADL